MAPTYAEKNGTAIVPLDWVIGYSVKSSPGIGTFSSGAKYGSGGGPCGFCAMACDTKNKLNKNASVKPRKKDFAAPFIRTVYRIFALLAMRWKDSPHVENEAALPLHGLRRAVSPLDRTVHGLREVEHGRGGGRRGRRCAAVADCGRETGEGPAVLVGPVRDRSGAALERSRGPGPRARRRLRARQRDLARRRAGHREVNVTCAVRHRARGDEIACPVRNRRRIALTGRAPASSDDRDDSRDADVPGRDGRVRGRGYGAGREAGPHNRGLHPGHAARGRDRRGGGGEAGESERRADPGSGASPERPR